MVVSVSIKPLINGVAMFLAQMGHCACIYLLGIPATHTPSCCPPHAVIVIYSHCIPQTFFESFSAFNLLSFNQPPPHHLLFLAGKSGVSSSKFQPVYFQVCFSVLKQLVIYPDWMTECVSTLWLKGKRRSEIVLVILVNAICLENLTKLWLQTFSSLLAPYN